MNQNKNKGGEINICESCRNKFIYSGFIFCGFCMSMLNALRDQAKDKKLTKTIERIYKTLNH